MNGLKTEKETEKYIQYAINKEQQKLHAEFFRNPTDDTY